MKERILMPIVIVTTILLNIISKSYISLILIQSSIVVFLIHKQDFDFYHQLLKLKMVNQIYIERKDKLKMAFDDQDLDYEDYCEYLKNKTKRKKEKEFYSELKMCSNKTQIDHLIDTKSIEFKVDDIKILTENLIMHMFVWIIYLFFPSLNQKIIQSYILICINIVTLLTLIFNNHSDIFLSSFDKFYIEFYQKLAYLRPMKALEVSIEKYQNSKQCQIYSKIHEAINAQKTVELNCSIKRQNIITEIYRICYLNVFKKEEILKSYYFQIKKFSLGYYYQYFIYILMFVIICEGIL